MQITKKEIDVLLPLFLSQLQSNQKFVVKDLQYVLKEQEMEIQTAFIYGGLPIQLHLGVSVRVESGALLMEIGTSQIDSLFMKGDVVPLLRNLIRSQPHLCLQDRTLYFYDPKIPFQAFRITPDKIEITFK